MIVFAFYTDGQWKNPQPSALSFLGGRGGGGGETDELDSKWPRAGGVREDTSYRRQSKVHDEGHSWSSQGGKRWPTPCATDYKGSNKIGQRRGQLPEAVLKYPLWPTPTTQDAKNDGSPSQQDRNSKPLNALVVSHPEGHEEQPDARPRLNPVFVEILMGFPHGWTDLNE